MYRGRNKGEDHDTTSITMMITLAPARWTIFLGCGPRCVLHWVSWSRWGRLDSTGAGRASASHPSILHSGRPAATRRRRNMALLAWGGCDLLRGLWPMFTLGVLEPDPLRSVRAHHYAFTLRVWCPLNEYAHRRITQAKRPRTLQHIAQAGRSTSSTP